MIIAICSFAFIRQLCKDTGAPFQHRVFLVPDVNAAVSFQESFLLIGILSVICIAVAILIRDKDAAATMDIQAHGVPDAPPEAAGTPAS